MNAEKYFSVENGREVMLGKLYDLKAAIGFAEKNIEAKEIFAYTPPGFFEARVLLTEVEFSDFPGEKVCGMSVYMAPKETNETYAEGMMYEGQTVSTKEIGVDTARKKYVDAVAIHLSMPEFDSYEIVKQRMQYFFTNIRPVGRQEKNTRTPAGKLLFCRWEKQLFHVLQTELPTTP